MYIGHRTGISRQFLGTLMYTAVQTSTSYKLILHGYYLST